ncbi:hypothetical protein DUHN55_08570 [Helicobacter pylori]
MYFRWSRTHTSHPGALQSGHGIDGRSIEGHGMVGRSRSGIGIDGRSQSGHGIDTTRRAASAASRIGMTTLPTPAATCRAA